MTNVLQLAQVVVLILSYIGLGLGYLPGLQMNRATISLANAVVLIGLGAISLEDAWQAIDASTIVFLLSMMVVNAYLSGWFIFGHFQVTLVA